MSPCFNLEVVFPVGGGIGSVAAYRISVGVSIWAAYFSPFLQFLSNLLLIQEMEEVQSIEQGREI